MHINWINPWVEGFSGSVFQLGFFLLYLVMVEKRLNPFLLLFKEVQQFGVSLAFHNMGNSTSRVVFVNQSLLGLFVPSHVVFCNPNLQSYEQRTICIVPVMPFTWNCGNSFVFTSSHCIFLLSWMRSFTQSYLTEITWL
ncbi:hypothetical protein AMTRI_Chr06g196420 [Amborella trichopoda]